VSSLSHLRRVSTPVDKSGKLVAPRKLHPSTWGYFCPAETPEGGSVGIVKNISYMTHITISTNSETLYAQAEPYMQSLDACAKPSDVFGRVKVFINGAWVGVTDDPVRMFHDFKAKKLSGLISVYCSVVFDYRQQEIRICNDGGRLTRPVLRVKNNAPYITRNVIDGIKSGALRWDDFMTNLRMEQSIIEYIDPDEQNFSMVAMTRTNAPWENKPWACMLQTTTPVSTKPRTCCRTLHARW
ncbi:MAG: hypothetical protein EBU92_11655, partial [Betaproteobacteria bacterium]|nr:hypothetical protein [Betaproteobacteria bacterium]